ncbi:DNA-directed RNA polymerase [Trypanosoma theileri]|uniref:DNA-directed RNA polymerase subunit n=1 Tax=Trypanosoma theileri TaxID=67003 RepID=A0A1X0P371_9TRYP|nr:DNA-directed RNA polymerase [Trypanosoma theileri]ORC91367.1 DNA-directed RNA polymerase [Trypanosoma theileri]
MSTFTSARALALGSTYCAVCGQWVSQQNNNPHSSTNWCQHCGSMQTSEPGNHHHHHYYDNAYMFEASNNTSAALLFTPAEIRAAQEEVIARRKKINAAEGGETTVGITQVDNRVLEEAFCENCGVHRQCKVFARQTRSADEGQTIFYQCTKCQSEWQLNS